MNKDERRKQDDFWNQQVKARLARIKVAIAAKQTRQLRVNLMAAELASRRRKEV